MAGPPAVAPQRWPTGSSQPERQ